MDDGHGYTEDKGNNNNSGSDLSVEYDVVCWNKRPRSEYQYKRPRCGRGKKNMYIHILGTYIIIFQAFDDIQINMLSNEKYVAKYDTLVSLLDIGKAYICWWEFIHVIHFH